MLNQADAIMEQDADSALSILEKIDPNRCQINLLNAIINVSIFTFIKKEIFPYLFSSIRKPT